MAHQLQQMPKVWGTFVMPDTAQWMEETLPDGTKLRFVREYTAHPQNMVKRPKETPTRPDEAIRQVGGEEQVWRLSPDGGKFLGRAFEVTYGEYIDYVPVSTPGGSVYRNFDFRPSPEEIEQQRLARAREQALNEFAAAVDSGMSVDDLKAFMATRKQEIAKVSEAAVSVQKRPGRGDWYDVYYRGEKYNDKALRKGEADELADTLRGALDEMTGGSY